MEQSWQRKQGEFFKYFEEYSLLCKNIEMQFDSYGFSEYAHINIMPVGGQFDGKTVWRSHSGSVEKLNEFLSRPN